MMQRLSGYPLVAFAVPMWGLARLLFYLTSLVHYHHNADPRTLQMGGKCHRRIVLSNASHAIVETLGRLGVNCILVSDIAAHMLGSASVPKVRMIQLNDDSCADVFSRTGPQGCHNSLG